MAGKVHVGHGILPKILGGLRRRSPNAVFDPDKGCPTSLAGISTFSRHNRRVARAVKPNAAIAKKLSADVFVLANPNIAVG